MAGERFGFEADVETEGTGTFFKVPLDVRELFGKARPPVRVTIEGHTFRTTIAVYGGEYYVGINKENREAAGVEAGARVSVSIELDEEPREIEAPEDLAAALGPDSGWDELSYSHQREYVEWIEEAKKPETRERRVAQTVERVVAGRSTDG